MPCLGMTPEDNALLQKIREKSIPYVVVYNKCDLTTCTDMGVNTLCVSAKDGTRIHELKETIARLSKTQETDKRIISDKLQQNDLVVLVVPIDSSAPKGRLILPQQQTIRDIIDHHAAAVVIQDTELAATLGALARKPKMVITDSQAFAKVSKLTPEDITLTSFSILFANYKGNLRLAVQGVTALDRLQSGDSILISEGCTHHRQCGDIGTVKLPALIRKYTSLDDLKFSWTSGTEFAEDLKAYRLIIHCGGCMLNEREMQYRLKCAEDEGVPITNYGTAIAYMNGILKRSLAPFPEIQAILS